MKTLKELELTADLTHLSLSGAAFKDHPNSYKVTIRRFLPMLFNKEGVKQKAYDVFYSKGNKSIGAFYSKTSKSYGTGLTDEEVDAVFPSVCRIPVDHKDYEKKRSFFYNGMSNTINPKIGLTLEIGMQKDNNKGIFEVREKQIDGKPVMNSNGEVIKELVKFQDPINPFDWLIYQHHRAHPQVAGDIQEAKTRQNNIYKFFVDDKEAQDKYEESLILKRKTAEIAANEATDNPEKLERMLTLLGVDTVLLSNREMFIALDKLMAEKNPSVYDRIIELSTDKRLEHLSILEKLLSDDVGVLIYGQSGIIRKENGMSIGVNKDEAVGWLMSKKNTDVLNNWKYAIKKVETEKKKSKK